MLKIFSVILFILASGFLLLPFYSFAVTVGPVKMEYSVDPGGIIEGKLFLMNETGGTQTFYPSFEKFIEVSGEKQFLPKESTELARWFKTENSITLGAGEQKNVPFVIEIPQNAPPGGHFAVIWWSTAPPDGPGARIVTRAGILVYLRVSGDIKESGEVLSFDAVKFHNWLPVNFNLIFKNTGNVHLKPTGEIKIKNIFGITKAVLSPNPNTLQVLPESEKSFTLAWNSEKWGGFAFGPYSAKLNLIYGEEQKEISKKIWFFVFPWKISLIAILVLLILIFGFTKGIKRYNRWIINKAQNVR